VIFQTLDVLPFRSCYTSYCCNLLLIYSLLRSLFLRYYSTIEVRGITLYKYFAPPELFKYTADVRAGFCVPNNLTCVPDGLLDISVCQPLSKRI
jgi:hypothetical protein